MWCLINFFFYSSILEPIYKFLNGGNMFTKLGKYNFSKIVDINSICWREIDCTTFALAFFADVK